MDEGLFNPDTLMRRYEASGDRVMLASALFEAYQTLHGGQGTTIVVPTDELIAALRWETNPKKRLERELNAIAVQERVGWRFQGDHDANVVVWFPPHIAERTRTYERIPLDQAS